MRSEHQFASISAKMTRERPPNKSLIAIHPGGRISASTPKRTEEAVRTRRVLICLAVLATPAVFVVGLRASGGLQPPGQAAASPFDRLKFRGIGPSIFSGRVNDLAVYE